MQTQNKAINLFEMLSIMFSPDFDKSEWEFSWGTYSYWFPVSEFESNKSFIVEYAPAPATTVFRKIKKTQVINGFTVPTPVKDWKELEIGSYYYTPNFHLEGMVANYQVDEKQDSFDNRLMERGLVFKTEEDALAVAKAMLGIDPYK